MSSRLALLGIRAGGVVVDGDQRAIAQEFDVGQVPVAGQLAHLASHRRRAEMNGPAIVAETLPQLSI